MEHKLIVENWRKFLLNETMPPPPGSENITTIGELMKYFKDADKQTLRRLFAKYGKVGAQILGTVGTALATSGFGAGAGAATGVAAVASGALAQKAVEAVLVAGALAFADVEDGTYQDGDAISYFDLDDKIQTFLRDVEHGIKGSEAGKVSRMEKEVIDKMINHAKARAKEFGPGTLLSTALRTTAKEIMAQQFGKENKIKIQSL